MTTQRAIRIGITGKIGSGKSTLARLMAARGMTVIDTDSLAKELMERDPTLRKAITALLGAQAYREDALDRAYVAGRIFPDAQLRRELEAIVHPAVTRSIEEAFAKAAPGQKVAVESALILQTDLERHFDYILLVQAPDEVVLERLATGGRFTLEDLRARLAGQDWAGVDLDLADLRLENTGTEADLERRAGALLDLLDILALRSLPEQPLHSLEGEEEDGDEEGEGPPPPATPRYN